MLLSYCYIFPHSSSSSLEAKPQSSRGRDGHTSYLQAYSRPAGSSLNAQPNAESENSVLDTLAHYTKTIASKIQASIPSAVTASVSSFFSTDSSDSIKTPGSSLQPTDNNRSFSGLKSWFASPSPDAPQRSQFQHQAPARSFRSGPHVQHAEEASSFSTTGRTTFTFVLFGAASSAAVYLLVKNRRIMNRLQAAKGMAYRDARAWRRVALNFARINALAASRVQNLVAASLRDGQAGGEIGRQIERELEEATRAVAQRRNWIREQDAKEAQAGSSSTSERGLGTAWGDVFDLDRTGFFFGSRAGRRGSELGEYGRWGPKHVSRHDDVPSASSDGVAFKTSEAWTRSTPSTSEEFASSSTPAKRNSPQLKWQHVAGHSAAASPVTTSKAKTSVTDSDVREEWIGDVEGAIRERDLKTTQSSGVPDKAAVDAFSRYESEDYVEAITGFPAREHEPARSVAADEEGDHLLPVSYLSIATNGSMHDDVEQSSKPVKASSKMPKAKLGPARVKTAVTSSTKYEYPISDQFRDLEDIFMVAWDDSYAGLSRTIAAELASDLETVEPKETGQAKPSSALFDKRRSQRSKAVAKPESSSADLTEFMVEWIFQGTVANGTATSAAKPVFAASRPMPSDSKVQELIARLDSKEAELTRHKYTINELSDRLDKMREMCHDLTDEAQRRDKTHRIHIEQLEQKVGLFIVWAEEVQRRLGLETPPFFASLRKPLKRD
ncbi:hypothetical protein NDA13_001479 [Ustilago tritici]|nr:hypothetical protein NDA13_001479 [Ustilago tritici]